MFFKNLLIYRLTQDIDFDADALESALATKRAREPASQEISTYGFIAPLGTQENSPLVHASSGFLLIGARKAEKNIPGSAVRDELKARVDRIEKEQMRKVYKKERDQIKDEILQEFLPKAFIRRKAVFAAIDPQARLILVNASSPRDAEDLLSTLREVIGSLPVRPITVKVSVSATLTDWLKAQQLPDGFLALDECTLRDMNEDGGTASLKRQDLTADEAQLHMHAGKVATKLSMAYEDKLSFVIDDRLAIRRLKFEDLLQEQAENDGGEDSLGVLDASFVIMMLTFRQFIPQLLDALGGEEIPQGLGDEAAPPTIPEEHEEGQYDAFSEGLDDPLYREAVIFVQEAERCTISALQRKYKVGYSRAARMVERMEAEGVVTSMDSHGHREVIA